jgi:MFS superfamily sulfate permease-like transporter
MVFRPEASLLYFNIEHICDSIQDRVRAEKELPGLVVIDLSAAAHVDMQSAYSLAGLANELRAAGSRLQVVEALASVRDRFRSIGIEDTLGGVDRLATVADAVAAFAAPK